MVSRAVLETLEGRRLLTADVVDIKDINPATSAPATPSALADINGTVFFSAAGALWKSDGSAGGTVQVSTNAPNPTDLTNVNGTLFFLSGSSLWKSNGTNAGTVLLSSGASNPRDLTAVNGQLFYRGTDGAGGELWHSDGTPGGTSRVTDINPGSASGDPRSLVNVNGRLFFSATDGVSGNELWTSDGTAGGTVRVKDILPGAGGSEPLTLTNVNGALFFVAHNAADSGYELWKSDGTDSGTSLVRDIRPGNPGSSPTYLTNVNGKLMFVAADGTHGFELWTSDGTTAGTVMVRDIVPGGGSSTISDLTALGGTVYFSADDGSGQELWKSDGTSAGTTRVKDIGLGATGSDPGLLTAAGSRIFFTANDGVTGHPLWSSDGTDAGTSIVSSSQSYYAAINNLCSSAGRLFFVAQSNAGPGLWVSGGTSATTSLLKVVTTFSPAGGSVSTPVVVNGALYFSANDGVNGQELWKSDGTTAGTQMLVDLTPGAGSTYPQELTNVNGVLYFTAQGKLWRSDGTAAGTIAVSPIAMSPSSLTIVGTGLYFTGYDGGGLELWKSDGTAAGTARVKDINPGGGTSNPLYLTNVNGTLFFVADDGVSGQEIWKSNGTDAGTMRVKDIRPGTDSSGPLLLTNVNGTLFFRATEGVNGYELWKSDGTDAGTVMVKDIRPGSGDSVVHLLTAVGSSLFFVVDDGVHGQELWKSDGSAAGTVMVRDIAPGTRGSTPVGLTNVNGTLFLRADDGVSGSELWKSDGTSSGTVMVADIHPGAGGADLRRMMNVNGSLVFVANNGQGYDYWRSDGTANGTFIGGINSNYLVSSTIVSLNGDWYFTAWRSTSGDELRKFSPNQSAAAAISASPASGDASSASVNTWQQTQAAAAAAGVDVFYDTSLNSDKPSTGAGTPGMLIDYGSIFTDWDYALPDESRVRELARQAVALGDPLVFDVENWPIDIRSTSEAIVQQNLEKLRQMVDWAHDERPAVKVGFYGLLPIDTFPAAVPGQPGYDAWHAATQRVITLMNKVDILLPNVYLGAPFQFTDWRINVDDIFVEAETFGKPVLPFYMMRYNGFSPNGFPRDIPTDIWRMHLDMAQDLADGATIWDGGGNFVDDLPWWTVTRDFLINSDPMVPAAATALGASTVSTSRVDLVWTDNAYNETGYRVERRIGSTGAFVTVATLARNATAYSDTSAAASTNYTYRVIALNASAGDAIASNESTVRTPDSPVPPAAPSLPLAAPLSTSRVNLTWVDNSPSEQGFAIERSDSGGAFVQITTVGTDITSFQDSGLQAGTTYTYRVRAYNAWGNSTYSAEIGVTTLQTDSNALGRWTFDDGAGSTAADASGAGHTAALIGGPSWTSGQLGSALFFDGLDDRAVVADTPSLRFTQAQDFTLSAWVNLSSLPGRRSAILTKSRANGAWYGIGLDASNHWLFTGASDITGTTASLGWTLITAVQDGTSGTRKLYVNGALVASGAAQAANGTGDLWIGGAESVSEFFVGKIDDVRIYGRALSLSDALSLATPHVTLNGTGGNDTFTARIDPTGNLYEFTADDGVNAPATFTRPRDAVGSIDIVGGSGNDRFIADFSNGDPLPAYGFTFDGGAGSDTIDLRGAGPTTNFTGDASHLARGALSISYVNAETLKLTSGVLTLNAAPPVALDVETGGTVVFATSVHVSSLLLASGGKARIAAGGNKALYVDSLTISTGGSLDVRDNALITRGNVGGWSSGAYSGFAGLIASGRNGGTWTGSGIVTTDPRAINGSVGLLGTSKIATMKNIADNATTVFAGQTVTGSDVVVLFTYGGDANLDGKINIDDYTRLDFNVPLGTNGYINGDFNLDGKINVDDYTIIDFNVAIQGAPMFTGPASASAASYVWRPPSEPVIALPERDRWDLLDVDGNSAIN